MLARVQAAGKLALHLFLQSDVIDIKGRIACELSSADELLLTEMMFNGVFNELSPEQSAAVLSCFVTDEKSNEMPKLTQASSGLKLLLRIFILECDEALKSGFLTICRQVRNKKSE